MNSPDKQVDIKAREKFVKCVVESVTNPDMIRRAEKFHREVSVLTPKKLLREFTI